MKKKDFSSLGGKLLPYLPDFKVKGALIFAEPVGHVLRGIAFQSSTYTPGAFYINVFFQLLCVPSDFMHFTLGFRLSDMDSYGGWSSDRPNLVADIGEAIVAKAIPLLDAAITLEGAARAAEAMKSSNSHVQETAAFCWALAGDTQTALSRLENLGNSLNHNINRDIAWQANQLQRLEYIKKLLCDNPSAAREQLLTWEAETAQRIGLGSYWSQSRT